MPDLLELAKTHGFIEEPPKKEGIEIALEALKLSNPHSPVIPYLEKLINKKRLDKGISGV